MFLSMIRFIWRAAHRDHNRYRLEADPRAAKQMREVKYSILHSLTVTGSSLKNEIQASGQLFDSEKISLRPNPVLENEVGAAKRRQLHFSRGKCGVNSSLLAETKS